MRKLFLTILLLCTLAASACAETRSYTYGGSGHDILYDAAVSADGRIVLTGTTDSADGTLSSRTKAGRSGWALCIDAQGHVLWNFCTRRGSYDTLRYPVFMEDGSVAMLLDTSHSGLYEVEWILLDRDGNQLERKILDSRGVPWIVKSGGAADDLSSYVIHALNKKTTERLSLLYTFDGELIRETDYTEGKYFPDPVLADGTCITIENDQDVPLDVTVTFHAPASPQMLRVAPADGSDGALLYSQPDESSTPLGKCLTGIDVTQLAPAKDGFIFVHVQGYDGYMRAEDLESINTYTIMP
ncbi:MAG: hypothetical protein J6K32_06940 [Clostridia bacterium]|nr:hypothetical protein [Clostridia bacterium]